MTDHDMTAATSATRYAQLSALDAMHALHSHRCPGCGDQKIADHALCQACYLALPLYMRGFASHGSDGPNFIEFYRRAIQHLVNLKSIARVRILPNGMRWRYESAEDLEAAGFRFNGHARCEAPGCYARIVWYWSPQGRKIAVNLCDSQPHFLSCKNPHYFQKRRTANKSRSGGGRTK